jgi:hypothetical protein
MRQSDQTVGKLARHRVLTHGGSSRIPDFERWNGKRQPQALQIGTSRELIGSMSEQAAKLLPSDRLSMTNRWSSLT